VNLPRHPNQNDSFPHSWVSVGTASCRVCPVASECLFELGGLFTCPPQSGLVAVMAEKHVDLT
jgi:hypothetical protein